jgi:hypothetical protein
LSSFEELARIQIAEAVFFEISIDRERKMVWVKRTEAPFHDLQQLDAAFTRLLQTLAPLECKRSGLLMDLRRGPGRNDAAFEGAVAPHRKGLCALFRRVGILVSSASGRLQTQRHAQQDGATNTSTYTDEGMAFRFLEGSSDAPSARSWTRPT